MTDYLNYLTLAASILSIPISIVAFYLSIKSSRQQSSVQLSEIHNKISHSRFVMMEIFQEWCESQDKKIEAKTLRESVSIIEKENFIDFYNKNYHNLLLDNKNKRMSDEIHQCLHELHNLWERHLRREFSENEIRKLFAASIKMDAALLLTYLEAHWKEHNELSKTENKRFWHNVPIIIERAKNWEP